MLVADSDDSDEEKEEADELRESSSDEEEVTRQRHDGEGELAAAEDEDDSAESSEAMDVVVGNNDDESSSQEEQEHVPSRFAAEASDFRMEALRLLRRRLRRTDSSRSSCSLRHSGCINTACWLTTPWRLSTVREQDGKIHSSLSAVPNSTECTTQLATSGDDRLVKFWDVSKAMGMTSPWSGGWDSFCPFASEIPDLQKTKESWKANVAKRGENAPMPGDIQHLAMHPSGHRGNVFHVTPISSQPGKVLTCAADGYLRLSDLVGESSSVVIHPYLDDENGDFPFVLHSGMAFSHHMLSRNTGLLCSERGLHHFDLRLSPREQNKNSLIDYRLFDASRVRGSRACKACAVWTPGFRPDVDGEVESSYVFAGGSGPNVYLFDTRMDGSKGRIVENYKPDGMDRNIAEHGGNVSVSGLDVCRNGRELLVSFESDQIYSFPIGHSLPRSPTLSDIDALCQSYEADSDTSVPELTSYGGHLNRFTFLKNARYAGPNDEYVCTGSDSGHAWIFDRNRSTVAALLGADCATCNGVVPHPILPFFITYGIDSTAKLWRATPPVDETVDDSCDGRARRSLHQPYELSPVTKGWEVVQGLLKHITEEPAILPDYVPSPEELAASGRFSFPRRRGICSVAENSPRVGNALQCLPSVLRQNRFECYKGYHEESDIPVESKLSLFSHRVSLARLRHQADRCGLIWDPWAPWAFETKHLTSKVHPADLVPDCPSDWINYDHKMQPSPMFTHVHCNVARYDASVFAETFTRFFDSFSGPDGCLPWLEGGVRDVNGGDDWDSTSGETSRMLLYRTALLCKEAGNEAMRDDLFDTAARRYDKAIQYCAVAFMRYYEGQTTLSHLTEGHHEIVQNDGQRPKASNTIVTWSPLLRVLVTSRLNMALLFLKPCFSQPAVAAVQARSAVKLLAPFTIHKGKVVSIRDKEEHIVKVDEPPDTYLEAQSLAVSMTWSSQA